MLREAAEAGLRSRPLRLAKKAIVGRLAALRTGRITINDQEGAASFGSSGMCATLDVLDPRFYERCLLGGSLGAAESYLEGEWNCDNLTSLFRILAKNDSVMDAMESGLSRAGSVLARAAHALRRNTGTGSRRNIAEHYDLGNDFFRLFLDDTMTYSCGVFEHAGASMRDASIAKIDRLCRGLRLAPTDHLLEIGTGWGGLAIHAAREYGCRVTTTTISRQQYDEARERVAQAGLSGRVEVLFEDYRDLRGQFDKLVSVEMIEAVGREYLEPYFRACRGLLKPDGAMALQGILMADRRYAGYCRRVDFIQKYVFPGSHLPSLGAIVAALGRGSDFTVRRLEDLTPHYGETLRRWRSAFWERAGEVRRMGYPERFLRMWDYYLCYCEAGFEERNILLVQTLLARPEFR